MKLNPSYRPSEEFANLFDKEIKEYTILEKENGLILFKASTLHLGIIQFYFSSLEEMEKKFVHEIRKRLEQQKPRRISWMQDDGWGE